MRDAINKQRLPCKLTELDVLAIRLLNKHTWLSHGAIGCLAGVNKTTVHSVVNHKYHVRRITRADVDEMRRIHAAKEMTQLQIAKKFELSKQEVNRIVNNKVWVTIDPL